MVFKGMKHVCHRLEYLFFGAWIAPLRLQFSDDCFLILYSAALDLQSVLGDTEVRMQDMFTHQNNPSAPGEPDEKVRNAASRPSPSRD